jgi:hypothetical protein
MTFASNGQQRLQLAATIYAQKADDQDGTDQASSRAAKMKEALAAEADTLIALHDAQVRQEAREKWERETPLWAKRHPKLAMWVKVIASLNLAEK